MRLTTLDLIVIVIYFAVLAGIGIHFSKQQTSRSEYFLGGRKTHWLLAGGSVLATLLSTVTYLTLPGEMIRYGIGFFTGFLALPFVVPLMNRTLLPMIKRLPITSAYEYLERRFDARVRTLTASLFIFRALIWMGLIIYTASVAVTEMSGWNIYLTIVIIGLMTTFYTSAGGLRTVIWTDNLQLVILFGGAMSIPVFIGFLLGSGPVAWWETFSQAGRGEIQAFSWDFTIRVTLVGALMGQFFWNICTHGSDQVAVQRYLATPTLEAARRSLWVYTIANMFLAAFLTLCGLALFAYYAEQSPLPIQAFQEQVAPQADRLMPRFIVEVLPSGFSGLLLAALLAAAMSSLSSGINSISSVVSSDFLERFRIGHERQGSLWIEKLTAVFAGVGGIAVAGLITVAMRTTNWNFAELTGRLNHIFVGPIAALFFAGVLYRRASNKAAVVGFAVGTLVSLYICFGKEWFGLERSISFLWVVPASFLAGFLTSGLVSRVSEPPTADRVKGLTMGSDL